MMIKTLPSATVFEYDPQPGRFDWLHRPVSTFMDGRACESWNTRYTGKEAFTRADPLGCRRGMILGRDHFAHRVALAWINGRWPDRKVDHIYRIPSSNRIDNLRLVTDREGALSRAVRKRSVIRFKGVAWHAPAKLWTARLAVGGKIRFSACFHDEEAAARAYDAAARAINGPIAYVNFDQD